MYTLPSLGKILKFMEFSLLENVLISQVFTMPPRQKSPQVSYHHPQERGKLLIPLGTIFLKIMYIHLWINLGGDLLLSML